MGFKIDITGERFANWSVLRFHESRGKLPYWLCRCDCGTEKSVWAADLKRGVSKSCGCMTKKFISEASTKHGMSRHPAYGSWVYMRSRCENENDDGFSLYGGRGITVCERWGTFEAFWEDMGATWRKGLSIERLNVNGNYEPGNCTWATAKEQADNRRDSRLINTPAGPMKVDEASKKYGVPIPTLRSRIRYGWTDPRKMVRPPRKTSRVYTRRERDE
ncbi:hypothetical protein ATY75_12210 [Rhizobium sp. N122]|uniref:hypothetical protein n=1 Tax=Rhizobium sp. N122 TaxID=1764272 RepID=UPI000B5A6C67|nr:hypothetical protein [Rhizobium sp. N122]OWV62580.1 hypothetical protein ATY75_12210 [Rhizobium sp. N122]